MVSTVRFGIQAHAQCNDISLYIDGINVGSLSPDDIKRLRWLLSTTVGSDETSAETFKQYHFLS